MTTAARPSAASLRASPTASAAFDVSGSSNTAASFLPPALGAKYFAPAAVRGCAAAPSVDDGAELASAVLVPAAAGCAAFAVFGELPSPLLPQAASVNEMNAE